MLVLAVLVTALCITGPAAAANEIGTFKLAKTTHGWPSGFGIAADEPYVINEIHYDSKGGFVDFTALPPSKSSACAGASQHLRCTWTFSKDVSTLSGRTRGAGYEGDPLFEVYVKWEADAPVPNCVSDDPYIYTHADAQWSSNPAENVRGFTWITTDPPWNSEMRYYPPDSANPSKNRNPPTAVYRMNLAELGDQATGGFSLGLHFGWSRPSWGGNNLKIAYLYNRVEDGTPTVTTVPQTAVGTITSVPGGTTPGTGGGGSGCSWGGTWQTNFGEMYLSQSGNRVTGTYVWDNGRIEGTVSGNTLTGRWSEAPSYSEPGDAGQFVFTMASDCGSFTGTAGYGSSSTGIAQSGTRGGSGTVATTAATVRTTAPLTTTTAPTTTERTTAATTVATTTSTGGRTTSGTGGATVRNGCPATGMLVYIDPWTPPPGQTIEIPVWCCNAQDLANMDLTVLYDPAVLTFVSARKGGLLGSDFLFESNDLGGQVRLSFAGTRGVSGSGAIAILTFRVAGATGSSTTIDPRVNTASNGNGGTLTVPTNGGTVTVTPPNPQNPEGRPCGPTALTALKALQMAVSKIPVDMAYDVTRDGTVNSADARELLRLATEEVCVL